MTETSTAIDCHYTGNEIACSYLLQDGESVAFIDNNTSHALPFLLKALKEKSIDPSQVEYLIVTHIHLDHAGGTSALLNHCPHAKVLAHPKAVRHLVNPSKLVESSRSVYGTKKFKKLYGQIDSIEASNVLAIEDGEMIKLGKRELRFIHTRGHADHHFCIHDIQDQTIYTGDSFGLGYPFLQTGQHPFLFASTTPTQFRPVDALSSIQKIIALKPNRLALTHFGFWTEIDMGAKQLQKDIENTISLIEKIQIFDGSVEDRLIFARNQYKKYLQDRMIEAGIQDQLSIKRILDLDGEINAQGIAFSAERKREEKNI